MSWGTVRFAVTGTCAQSMFLGPVRFPPPTRPSFRRPARGGCSGVRTGRLVRYGNHGASAKPCRTVGSPLPHRPYTRSHDHPGPRRRSRVFLDLTGMAGSFLIINTTPDDTLPARSVTL